MFVYASILCCAVSLALFLVAFVACCSYSVSQQRLFLWASWLMLAALLLPMGQLFFNGGFRVDSIALVGTVGIVAVLIAVKVLHFRPLH